VRVMFTAKEAAEPQRQGVPRLEPGNEEYRPLDDHWQGNMNGFSVKGFAKNHRRPVETLAEIRTYLQELEFIHEKKDGGPLSVRATALIRSAVRLENRLEWGPAAPLVLPVLGATGTGKSKVFNSLIGRNLSPSGFKRPTTLAPVLYLGPNYVRQVGAPGFLPGYEKRTVKDGVDFQMERLGELVIVPADDSIFGPGLLIDTPDFDSVLAANRAAARDVFDRSDAVIFVTDAVKYADQAAWDYLDLIKKRGKRAVLMVNRVRNRLSLEDFRRRLNQAGLDRPVFSLSDQPRLGDADLFPADEPAVKALDRQIKEWTGELREQILADEAGKDWMELRAGLREGLLPVLAKTAEELAGLRGELESSAQVVRDDLPQRLSVSISAELKHSLLAQIQALFLRWDLLKYPRRLMGLPFALVKDKVLAPLGLVQGTKSGRSSLDEEIERLFAANAEALVALVQEYNRQVEEAFNSVPAGRGLAGRAGFSGLAFSSEWVRAGYEKVRAELENWVQDQAGELARNLNLGEKMTFYLAQVLSLGLFISIQVHTGGGFSFFDGLLDSVLAPILSKLTGSALSRDKVKAFEAEAVRRHLALCGGLFDEQVQAYRDFLTQAEQGLAAVEPLAETFERLDRIFESLK